MQSLWERQAGIVLYTFQNLEHVDAAYRVAVLLVIPAAGHSPSSRRLDSIATFFLRLWTSFSRLTFRLFWDLSRQQKEHWKRVQWREALNPLPAPMSAVFTTFPLELDM